eukprot:TRINITY_DN12357_c0_g1_i1.p1 TRINITY_DN12357_c0_g1~~TRINITY_DN12357_c0_g1_i1.p1  ORF type:complete len:140 (+),score=44.83 TRINITY_DN12357_c0_g1_i1:49-468(+)
MDSLEQCPEIFYVWEKKLEVLRHLLKKKREITKDLLAELVEPPATAPASELMIPVDMAGFGEHSYEDVDHAVEKLGASGTAEAFVKSQECFQKFKSSLPEGIDPESIPQPMSIAEWREAIDEEEADEDNEPDAKKAKVE